MHAVIVGATGGIGAAFVRALKQDGRFEVVHELSRADCDLEQETQIAKAAEQIKIQSPSLDLVIVATGFLHDENTKPEKSLRDLNADAFTANFARNATGPLLIAKHFLPLLRQDQRSVFAALSARVGSISDNQLGGWYAYRMAKAALNMGIKCAAIETARRNKQAIVLGLHPGTTDTKLSKPFQSRVPNDKLFDPDFVAQSLLQVLDARTSADTGKCFDWAGKEILP